MNTLLLVNGWVGWKVTAWLAKQADCTIVGAVLHPEEKSKWGEEIRKALPTSAPLFDASQLDDPATMQAICDLKADIAVSVFFGYILRKKFLDLFPKGIVNLHPAYLPYNRGAYPNVWSIVEGTPAGVTLHYIDEGVDTGDVILQRKIPVALADTGATLYQKLDRACVRLFEEAWPLLAAGKAQRLPQPKTEGSIHRLADVESIDEISLDTKTTPRELLNRIRARTFPHYAGTYIRKDDGEKIYLRLALLSESEIGGPNDPPPHYED